MKTIKNDVAFEVVPVALTRNNTPPLFVTLKECNNKFRFQVRLKAGGKEEQKIDRIVRQNGLLLKLPGTIAGINTIGALGAIQNIYDLYGDKGLDDTLYVISKVFNLGYGIIMSASLRDVILLGMAHAISESNMNRYEIVDALNVHNNHERIKLMNNIRNNVVINDRGLVVVNMKNWVLSKLAA